VLKKSREIIRLFNPWSSFVLLFSASIICRRA